VTPAPTPSGGLALVDGFDSEQVGNAGVIVSVGMQLGIPVRGWIIAVPAPDPESRVPLSIAAHRPAEHRGGEPVYGGDLYTAWLFSVAKYW
jgi:hypothetical protein